MSSGTRPIDPKPAQIRRINAAFNHHPPKGDQAECYGRIRATLKDVALYLVQTCPDSRELNSAIKCLEETQYWAIAAIARNE